jgi:hypothetical protein
VQRTQFTFYESFFKAVSRIKKKADKADAYDMICAYALYQEEPDLESASDAVAIAFELLRPVLDKAKERSESGKKGGSKPEANAKQIESKPEANGKQGETASKKEKEIEVEIEVEKELELENEIDNNSSTPIRGDTNGIDQGGSIGRTATHGLPHGVRQNVYLTQREYETLVSDFGEMNVTFAIIQMGKWLEGQDNPPDPEKHYEILRKKLWKEPTLRTEEQ